LPAEVVPRHHVKPDRPSCLTFHAMP
jgi:hypothetical protein